MSLTSLHALDDYDPDSMPVEQAQRIIQQHLHPIPETECVPLRDALHRVLVVGIHSPVNVPPHDNSAMDGYAFRHTDHAALKIVGHAFAGHPYTGRVEVGTCIRIMTGAPIPDGCDTVVMQEHTRREDDNLIIERMPKPGQNIRRCGEDITERTLILPQGTWIQAAELGLLASLGFDRVEVVRKLRVALLSTGDEIRQPGEPLTAGQIYDSNRYSLYGMLQPMNVEIIDLPSIADDRDSLRQGFLDAARQADVVITSGGVSVGEADFIKALLAEIGEVVFWKIAMKPGRPLAFGKLGSAYFFGLPGNPVAVMVTFRQFVQAALRRLMGLPARTPVALSAVCTEAIRKIPGRTEFQRGILTREASGQWTVRTTGAQGSGILSSMSKANCFIVLPAEAGNIASGVNVEVQPFDQGEHAPFWLEAS
ncbi:MAG: gephyrin-like molybdotransferase Glp [Pseudomonadota bacterium]